MFPLARPQTDSYWVTRWVFQRALAAIYVIGFLIIIHQYLPLLGSHGLYPIENYVPRLPSFWSSPSLFYWTHSDKALLGSAWGGLILSVLALTGISERFGNPISALTWALLWILYLSYVNVGQVFYGFGWESILLETGFLAIFMGARNTKPSLILIWLLRWVLFRVMFGAGLIKIRGDECWRDLTCMVYHYETQPIPNPLSWFLHHLPPLVHKVETFCTHFIELIAPIGYFFPGFLGILAGASAVLFQMALIFSGNLSWLNYMTIVLAIACFPDANLKKIIPIKTPDVKEASKLRKGILWALSGLIVYLSIPPTLNMFSARQMMNASFNSLHLVNTYGAFGSVTKVRHEVIFLGTSDETVTPKSQWKEYEFKCKPGDVHRRPCIVSPYHLRLDWQIWFAAMSDYRYHPWVLNLIAKLLNGERGALSLLQGNPFPEDPPKNIRADLYEYRFTTREEKQETGAWWKRRYVRSYLPPLSLTNEGFRDILRRQKWI